MPDDQALTDLERMMNQARSKLLGASEAALKGELFDVFTEFFKDSSSWLEQIPVSIVANTTSYTLIPTQGQIIRLGGLVDANNLPQGAIMQTPPIITLAYTPTGGSTWTATVIKNVKLPLATKSFPDIPPFVLQLYNIVILDGLLGKMMAQVSKPHTNPTQSLYHLKRFRDGIAQARVATMRANSFGTQSWAFPQQWKTKSQKSGVSIGNTMGF